MARFDLLYEISLKKCLHRLDAEYEKKRGVKGDVNVWHISNQIDTEVTF